MCDVMWKNMVQPARQTTDDDIVGRGNVICFATEATDTYSEYAKLAVFPQQNWLLARASLQHYAFIDCLVYIRC